MMFGCRNGFFVVGQIKQTNSHPDGLRTECDRIFVYLIAMDTRKSGRPIDTFEWIEIFDYFFCLFIDSTLTKTHQIESSFPPQHL